jgi:two-component system chemotaxis response regulator CheB
MIDVLVVEDSRVTLDYLVYALATDPQIRVSATASSGEEALAAVARKRPDVILMDLHLPGIDGLETTRRIMSTSPVPIVVCTASTDLDQVQAAMSAIEAGALAALRKPRGLGDPGAETDIAVIVMMLKMMSEIPMVKRWIRNPAAMPPGDRRLPYEGIPRDAAIVAIGASIGGPPALSQVLAGLSPAFPVPILVVQHIAAGFTAGFAEWLAVASPLPVVVARGGACPLPGHVYVAPDDHHLRVGPDGTLQTTQDAPRNGLRPSVGVLFRSVGERFGRRAVGVLLTGMGRDGAEELRFMADRGAITIAQDEPSCVVFGMPGEAVRLGGARFLLPPRRIAELLTSVVRRGPVKGGSDG